MTTTLSESDSKMMLSAFGIPFLPEVLVRSEHEARRAATEFNGPVAAKLCGEHIAHKSERGLVRLGVQGEEQISQTVIELLEAGREDDGVTGVLLAPMASGLREFIAGVAVDPVFGPTVVFGVGGVLAEAFDDVVVRLAPLRRFDALDMMRSLSSQKLFDEFRGEPAVNCDALGELLMNLSSASLGISGLHSIDLNPVMIVDGQPVALDALVELESEHSIP